MTHTIKFRGFDPGELVATPGALAALQAAGAAATDLIDRHSRGDWGELNPIDAQSNEVDIKDGGKIMSVYTLSTGVTLWVITDAIDRSGRREATTILLPEEH